MNAKWAEPSVPISVIKYWSELMGYTGGLPRAPMRPYSATARFCSAGTLGLSRMLRSAVVASKAGAAGMAPTMAAIRNGGAVALANKMARTAWAIVAHGRTYQRDWKSTRPGSGAAQAAAA